MSSFKGRREDFRLIQGQGRYVSDWNLPGQFYARFRRADRRMRGSTVDTRRATAGAGVIAAVDGRGSRLRGNSAPCLRPRFPGRSGAASFVRRSGQRSARGLCAMSAKKSRW